MEKKLSCILRTVVVTLLLTLPSIAFATSAQNEDAFTQEYMDTTGFTEQGIGSVQLVEWAGSTCYVYMSDSSVYTYHTTEGVTKYAQLPPTPKEFERMFVVLGNVNLDDLHNTVTYIATHGDSLYGYNVYSGKFGHIDTEGVHWSDTILDMECLNPEQGFFPNRVAKSYVTNQRLYTLVSLISEYNGDEEYAFFGFDLSTGKAVEFNVKGAVNVCHIKDEEFIFLRRLEDGYSLVRLDAATNALSDISFSMGAFPSDAVVGGLAYDEKSDSIFLSMKGRIFRSVTNGEFEAVSYIPTDALMYETPAWILPDGRYALCSMNGLFIRGITNQMEHEQLIIRTDTWIEDVKKVFSKEYPNVNFNYIYERTTAEELAKILTTQDDSIDVFEICADYAYTALIKKGFTTDLSISEIIRQEVDVMDPKIASTLINEQGQIVAYPAKLRVWSSGIHEGYWKLAFGDCELPATIDEVMDAWIEWELIYADEFPDVEFMLGFDYTPFCQALITYFVQQRDTLNEQPDMNDAALRGALEKLRQVYEIRMNAGRSNTGLTPDQSDGIASIFRFHAWDEAMNERSSLVAKIPENYLYDMYMWDYKPINITFTKDDTPKTDGTLYVYVINPYSKNMEAAIKFIESVTKLKSGPYIYYAIHPEFNEPYEKPDFQQMIASYVQGKSELEEILRDTSNLHHTAIGDLQATLDFYNAYLENQEKEKWMISSETITKYRNLLDNLHLHTSSIYLGASGSAAEQMISELCARYTLGNMTLDAFLNELNLKMRMMQLENS